MKFIVLFFVAIAFVGCKPSNQDSQLQTLDNFAAGKRVSINSCSASSSLQKSASRNRLYDSIKSDYEDSSFSIEEYDQFKAVARKVLTAIPESIQMMFLEGGGHITITPKANAICGARVMGYYKERAGELKKLQHDRLRESMNEIESCYVFIPKGENIPQILDIYVQADSEAIRHGLVRTFGYLTAEFFSRIKKVGSTPAKYVWSEEENVKFRGLKQEIMKAFLSDLETNSFDPKPFERFTSKGEAPIDERNAFADWVFGEAFDSWYCNNWSRDPNKNTRRIMADEFARTHAIFRRIESGNSQGFLLAESDEPKVTRSLKNDRTRSQKNTKGYQSPFWAGTKAFFGSTWDNTGGRAKRGYKSYSNAVGKAVDRTFDGNVTSSTFKAVGSVVSDSTGYTQYREDVRKAVDKTYDGNAFTSTGKALGQVGVDKYKRYSENTRKEIDQRFDTQIERGNSVEGAYWGTLGGFSGKPVGTTDWYEAYAGYDTVDGSALTASERSMRVSMGAIKGIGVVSGVGTLKNLAGRSSIRAGVVNSSDDIARTVGSSGDDLARTVTAGCLAGPCDIAAMARKKAAALETVNSHKYVIKEAGDAWKKSPLQKVSPFDAKRFQESVVDSYAQTGGYKTGLASSSSGYRSVSTIAREQMEKGAAKYADDVGQKLVPSYKVRDMVATGGTNPATGKNMGGMKLGRTTDTNLGFYSADDIATGTAAMKQGSVQTVPLDVMKAAEGAYRN